MKQLRPGRLIHLPIHRKGPVFLEPLDSFLGLQVPSLRPRQVGRGLTGQWHLGMCCRRSTTGSGGGNCRGRRGKLTVTWTSPDCAALICDPPSASLADRWVGVTRGLMMVPPEDRGKSERGQRPSIQGHRGHKASHPRAAFGPRRLRRQSEPALGTTLDGAAGAPTAHGFPTGRFLCAQRSVVLAVAGPTATSVSGSTAPTARQSAARGCRPAGSHQAPRAAPDPAGSRLDLKELAGHLPQLCARTSV